MTFGGGEGEVRTLLPSILRTEEIFYDIEDDEKTRIDGRNLQKCLGQKSEQIIARCLGKQSSTVPHRVRAVQID
jgi:hypothetical protein